MRPVQQSVVAVQRHVMLSAVPSSGTVNSVIRISGMRKWWLDPAGRLNSPPVSVLIQAARDGVEYPGRDGVGKATKALRAHRVGSIA
jgi:hypothetical protein